MNPTWFILAHYLEP